MDVEAQGWGDRAAERPLEGAEPGEDVSGEETGGGGEGEDSGVGVQQGDQPRPGSQQQRQEAPP